MKNHLSEVVDRVEREHQRVVITKHGRPAAVVLSVDDLESIEETLDIAGRPQLMRQIRSSLAELTAGEAEALTRMRSCARCAHEPAVVADRVDPDGPTIARATTRRGSYRIVHRITDVVSMVAIDHRAEIYHAH